MRRITVTADKGGVGKTTTIANMAVCLHQLGKRVLVVDIDGQGDVTYALLGLRPPVMTPHEATRPTMYALMLEQATIHQIIIKAPKYPNIFILPANKDLDRTPLVLASDPGGTTVLKRLLDGLPTDDFDFVLIDTAKGRDLLLVNAVAAAQEVIVMITPGTLEIDAVVRTFEHVENVRTKTLLGASHPQVSGILMTRADPSTEAERETLTVATRRTLAEIYPDMLFETSIPESVDYRKAISKAQSIFEYAALKTPRDGRRYTVRYQRQALAYERFVDEVLTNGQKEKA